MNTLRETAVGLGVLLLGVGFGIGALDISSEAGYAGVGPNFLPWVVALALSLCGVGLLWEAQTGGFRNMEEDPSAAITTEGTPDNEHSQPYWAGFVWMSAGLLLNAALITTLGFILSCALCFVCAAQGLRRAQAKPSGGLVAAVKDGFTGLLIAAPVYWMFTQFLAINLPGLTSTGWL